MPCKLFNDQVEQWIRQLYETDGQSVMEIVRRLETEHGIRTSHPVVGHALKRQGVKLRTPSERNLLHYRGVMRPLDPVNQWRVDRLRKIRRKIESQRRRHDERMETILQELNEMEKQIEKEVA